MLSKVQDWPKFRPGIAFCTNQFHLPKNGRESLKLVSWNEISVWSIPTTFSDFPLGRVKNCFQGKVLSFFILFIRLCLLIKTTVPVIQVMDLLSKGTSKIVDVKFSK